MIGRGSLFALGKLGLEIGNGVQRCSVEVADRCRIVDAVADDMTCFHVDQDCRRRRDFADDVRADPH